MFAVLVVSLAFAPSSSGIIQVKLLYQYVDGSKHSNGLRFPQRIAAYSAHDYAQPFTLHILWYTSWPFSQIPLAWWLAAAQFLVPMDDPDWDLATKSIQ
jgi:hypothetical protein